ncbi:Crp/Fnr family transcriptional regulator [Bdellovibrionota bacterium FG-2]
MCALPSQPAAANPQPILRKYRAGEYLFHEGDQSKSLFIIKKGSIGIHKRKAGGYVELGKVHQNEVLGELTFFDRQPRSASAVALTDVECMELTFASLEKIYAGIPAYMKTIMAALAERLRKTNELVKRLQREVVTDKDIAALEKKKPEEVAPDAPLETPPKK